ncbi:MAG: metal-sensing transcriptional repressor [Candidatus Sulfotelmatobacter sp.]
MQDKMPVISKGNRNSCFASSGFAASSLPRSVLRAGGECADILTLLSAIRGGVNGVMAEVLKILSGCT